MKSMKRLHNVFPEPPEAFSQRVASTLEVLEQTNIKEVTVMMNQKAFKKPRAFRPLKVLAVAAAAVIALTVAVGAATDWKYGNVFSGLFGGGDIGNLGISENPAVSKMRSTTDNIDLEVLGIAGDDQLIHMVVKLTPKNGYVIDVFNYSLHMENFNPARGRHGVAGWGSGGLDFIEQLEDGSVIASSAISFNRIVADGSTGGWSKGTASMVLIKLDFSEKATSDTVMTFDVLVDYNFSAIRSLDVGEVLDLGTTYGSEAEVFLRKIDITPISVRYTIEVNENNHDPHKSRDDDGLPVVSVTLASGEVIEAGDELSGGGGIIDDEGNGFMAYSRGFAVPFDVDDVVAVTINGRTFAFA
ncbi:MAG: hypothetical protein FWD35_06260 [Oscillospiraceae bacterium]|nr:hypothetical protein [Oscillospiraceae bacterium]